jgi:hypothetical protein
VYNLSEDTKKRAILSEDALANVAGGTASENAQILAALAKVDPERVQGIFETAAWFNREDAINDLFKEAVPAILKENFGNSITIENSIDGKNKYTCNGKPMSHTQMLEFINSQGWEVIDSE